MGNLIQPACSCGYIGEQMMQGLGFSFFESGIYYEPAWCANCAIVEPMDGNDRQPTCSCCQGEMHFYKRGHSTPDSSSSLPDTDYLQQKQFWFCPACKEEKLEFMVLGMWD